jgi:hypothetical protein
MGNIDVFYVHNVIREVEAFKEEKEEKCTPYDSMTHSA